MNRKAFWEEMNDWSNHRILLWYALQNTEGSVCELGIGGGSTPFLHKYCKDTNRTLFSFENDKEWIEQFKQYRSENHIIVPVTDWDIVKDICPTPSVLLIDSAPGERRIVDAERFANSAEILIFHDTEKKPTAADYGWEKVWHLFKYQVTLELPLNMESNPPMNRSWASAVSQTYDVTQWRNFETGNPDYKIV